MNLKKILYIILLLLMIAIIVIPGFLIPQAR
jgi:hypothetical protein